MHLINVWNDQNKKKPALMTFELMVYFTFLPLNTAVFLKVTIGKSFQYHLERNSNFT